MKKVITYGTFDMFHQGHINLLRGARALGDYLIVGVTSDGFDRERGKLNVRQNVLERVEAVRKTGLADEIVIEDYVGQKIDDIHRFGVDIFTVGSDWVGQFDYLKEYCRVIYLPRTEGVSSSMLRESLRPAIKIGIIGAGRIAKRFVPESRVVSGVEVSAVFDTDKTSSESFASNFGLTAYCENYNRFLEAVDAVYVASPHLSHYDYAKGALMAGKHVLCEIPFVLSGGQAEELYEYAKKQNLVLLEACKTAFCPSFQRLVTMAKSGVIGEIVDVEASLSKMVSHPARELDREQAGGAMTEHSALPLMSVIKLLGKDYEDIRFYSMFDERVDVYTKIDMVYPRATASVKLGIGVKTEGNLIVSGTKGYLYVPAPWWLTDYFEVRFEDVNKNRKYFNTYEGEGLRYEIQEFVSMIEDKRMESYKYMSAESIAVAGIIGRHREGVGLHIISSR